MSGLTGPGAEPPAPPTGSPSAQETGEASRRRAWASTAVVCAALFLLGLDFTVLNVAVPALQEDLGPSMAQTQWIVDGYALVLGGCVLATGILGDTYGRRRAFVTGLVVCALASVLGARADAVEQVIVARCGMGLGAALFMPATLATIVHVFPDDAERRRAISLWAAVAGIGALAGPLAGGWLVEHATWRAVFWINVPLALVLATVALRMVPESRDVRPGRLDWQGAVLSCAGLSALVWAVIEAPGRGWTSTTVLGAFAVAGVLLGLFTAWEVRTDRPMVPPPLFKRGPVGPACVALAAMSFCGMGAMFILTLYLQQVRGHSPWEAGVRTIPLSLALAVGAAFAPALLSRFGARVPVSTGLLLVAGGFAVMARLETGSGYTHVLAFEALVGVGSGLVAPVATELVLTAVPAAKSGLGSALNDATRQVGSTLGVAVLGSVLATVFTARIEDRLQAHPAAQILLHDQEDRDLLTRAGHPGTGTGSVLVQEIGAAFVHGMATAAVVGAGAALLAAALSWRKLPASDRPPACPPRTAARPAEPVDAGPLP
ncbi:MFS transporter [Streptomyces sp. NPDC017448]|uniref:MFS transporter n=1 Tax=Streptomyces sp. NPDC017448 TaxID=3364996 RepID=UPI00378A82A5